MDSTVACQAPLSMGFSRQEYWKTKKKVKLLSRVQLFVTPRTIAYQAPPSMEFSRQGYRSGLPFPSPGDLPDSGIKPGSPTLQADTLPSEPPGKPKNTGVGCFFLHSEIQILYQLSPKGSPSVSVLFVKCYSYTTPWPNPLEGTATHISENRTAHTFPEAHRLSSCSPLSSDCTQVSRCPQPGLFSRLSSAKPSPFWSAHSFPLPRIPFLQLSAWQVTYSIGPGDRAWKPYLMWPSSVALCIFHFLISSIPLTTMLIVLVVYLLYCHTHTHSPALSLSLSGCIMEALEFLNVVSHWWC